MLGSFGVDSNTLGAHCTRGAGVKLDPIFLFDHRNCFCYLSAEKKGKLQQVGAQEYVAHSLIKTIIGGASPLGVGLRI